MFIHASLTQYLRRRAAIWRRRRTERFISSLPPEIQKDIGWPADARARGTHCQTDPALNTGWHQR